MKKLKNILILGFSSLFIASCSDALDIVQDGEIYPENAIKTVANLREYLNGDIYGRVNNTNEIAFTSIFTDEVGIGPDNGGQAIELHRFQLNANSAEPAALWNTQYALINRCNRLLEYSELVTPTNALETAQKNAIIAEARTLRAYAYLQLVSYFSVDPSNPNSLGVILTETSENPLVNEPRLRVTNQLIYDLMEEDLLFAQNNLLPTTDYKFVTPNLVNAIRARMYLYRKDYVLAKQYATQALALRPLVTNQNQYFSSWGDSGQGEIIFAASRPSGGTWSNIASTWYFNVTNATGGCFLDMGRNLFNLYDQYPNDVRRITWVDATAVINPDYLNDINYVENDILPINKYPGKTSQPLRNDLKLFRSSEMVLIIAECEVGSATPNLVEAATRVQSIRSARGTTQTLPVYANSQQAWADILLERRKELAFEGHRYIDIKRLSVLAGVPGIDRNVTDDQFLTLPLTLPVSDYRFTLPIPQLEIAGNVSIQQNPGY
ncbi:RagB/SusD family nutrient uptake outer membrane protein [Flavobacterium sp. 9AF]|uniref:RagB/SusD family nutrient uptake outer membrane protein n=1 Tax=Flavobacterium sp. 9AF TaxID=2653142 RepID=UPI0012EF6C85|nr:RagB/SusD family nutrient uptake outer membrane protein [Flavobacterium sp. 9AF]VXC40864.1 RagB/SusD family nutrient uptake outer membrane protein [Flavobacterium sp. 9AF]